MNAPTRDTNGETPTTPTTTTYPRGWFVIQFSDELAVGDVKPIRYFGKDLVLFRGENGVARVFDAFCPHLGAHLGHGGKVAGDAIVCPFHAWKFGADGKCVEIPYAKRVPPQAKVACWHVDERDGMIFLWNDADGLGPEWALPDLSATLAGFSPWNHSVLEIATHPREIIENIVDTAHFMPVHGTDAKSFRNTFEGHVATQYNEGIAYPLGGGEDRYSLTATYYGPAYMVTHMTGVMESLMINAHTPIGPNQLHLRFAVALKQKGDRPVSQKIVDRYVENLRSGYLQDVAIWEHKVFRERPLLCDGDGEIPNVRRWYRKFYQPRETTTQSGPTTATAGAAQ